MLAFLAASAVLAFAPTPATVATQITGVPVQCYPTVAAWNADASEAPSQQWWLGIAGFYHARDGRVGLTPNICSALARLGTSSLTLTQAIAVFSVAHEWGHVLNGPDEQAADCYRARHSAEVAYRYGLRGHEAFFELRDFVTQYAGYERIPAACFGS